MKACPFCKNTIAENNDICPYCKRVLVERIYSSSTHRPNASNQNAETTANKQSRNYFKQLSNKLKNLKWNNFKKYVPILALLLLIIFIGIQKRNNNTVPVPVSVIPNKEGSLNNLNGISKIQAKNSKTYNSLSNGTAISSNYYYFNGLGQLKIDNGTNLDAIAKLVDIATNRSIFTLYIKANNTYNISGLSDGNYKLFFNLGNDWNMEIKAFTVNSSYEVFEENFNFVTSEYEEGDYLRTRYTTFNVTLNPVVNGQAKTNKINAKEFASY